MGNPAEKTISHRAPSFCTRQNLIQVICAQLRFRIKTESPRLCHQTLSRRRSARKLKTPAKSCELTRSSRCIGIEIMFQGVRIEAVAVIVF